LVSAKGAAEGVGVYLILFAAGIAAALLIPIATVIIWQFSGGVFDLMDMTRMLSLAVIVYYLVLTIVPALIATVSLIVVAAILGPYAAPLLEFFVNNLIGGFIDLLGSDWTYVSFTTIDITTLGDFLEVATSAYTTFLLAWQTLMLAVVTGSTG